MQDKEYLALFDLDGTLFDTDDVNYLSYETALKSFDIKVDRDFFINECSGKRYREFLPKIMGGLEHIEEVHLLKKENYTNYLDKARQNVHLFEIAMLMKERYHLAIVTTASRRNTVEILNKFGCQGLFDCLITQEDITKDKPNPQGFELAMRNFNKDAAHTVIFEDSLVGVQAAKATGATVFIVGQI